MKNEFYTNERNVLILISLLKRHGIRRVVASPGTGNMAFVVSMQHDSYFEMYSCIDERSAAYIACGMAAESGEPVVITCTEATASRNYMPGLTEAYYRKLPILAVMAGRGEHKAGFYEPQSIDNRVLPNDAAKFTTHIPVCKSASDVHYAETKINEAISQLYTHGGGPVCITLESYSSFSADFSLKELPTARFIKHTTATAELPALKERIAVLVGAHGKWSAEETRIMETFCERNNAAVLCDLTSNYTGKYRVNYSLVSAQEGIEKILPTIGMVIYIGTVCGDYYTSEALAAVKEWWLVNEDGIYHDRFLNMTVMAEMSETDFLSHYIGGDKKDVSFYRELADQYQELYDRLPELPLSNIWMAKEASRMIPDGSVVHATINNSFRSWNFFQLPPDITGSCNVGGFGIDGGLSTLVGASLMHPEKLYFGIVGDLSFFYDMNVLGNRHIGNNLRVLLVNNGKGQEFRNYQHSASLLGDDADKFVAAGGHYGCQSRSLVKEYAASLGFDYYSASDKEQFLAHGKTFFSETFHEKPIFLEVFTDSKHENEALRLVRNIVAPSINKKQVVKSVLGVKGTKVLKAIKDSLES